VNHRQSSQISAAVATGAPPKFAMVSFFPAVFFALKRKKEAETTLKKVERNLKAISHPLLHFPPGGFQQRKELYLALSSEDFYSLHTYYTHISHLRWGILISHTRHS
jgi:hypothetical protein